MGKKSNPIRLFVLGNQTFRSEMLTRCGQCWSQCLEMIVWVFLWARKASAHLVCWTKGPVPQFWGHCGAHKPKAWNPGLDGVSWIFLDCDSFLGLQYPMVTGRHCCSPGVALVSIGRSMQWNISCWRNWSAKCNPLGSTRPSKALTPELGQTNSGITNIVDFACTKCHFLWAFILSPKSRFKGKHKY